MNWSAFGNIGNINQELADAAEARKERIEKLANVFTAIQAVAFSEFKKLQQLQRAYFLAEQDSKKEAKLKKKFDELSPRVDSLKDAAETAYSLYRDAVIEHVTDGQVAVVAALEVKYEEMKAAEEVTENTDSEEYPGFVPFGEFLRKLQEEKDSQ